MFPNIGLFENVRFEFYHKIIKMNVLLLNVFTIYSVEKNTYVQLWSKFESKSWCEASFFDTINSWDQNIAYLVLKVPECFVNQKSKLTILSFYFENNVFFVSLCCFCIASALCAIAFLVTYIYIKFIYYICEERKCLLE